MQLDEVKVIVVGKVSVRLRKAGRLSLTYIQTTKSFSALS